jgi:hypothetical protein
MITAKVTLTQLRKHHRLGNDMCRDCVHCCSGNRGLARPRFRRIHSRSKRTIPMKDAPANKVQMPRLRCVGA